MKLPLPNGVLCKSEDFRFQHTFRTPLDQLGAFVSTILAAHPQMAGATFVVENWVFEPTHLLAVSGVSADEIGSEAVIRADSTPAAESLLVAALSDWVDLFFIPEPRLFVIYADHDEYCTFYSGERSNLARVREALINAGFQMVEGYERSLT